MRTYIFAKSVSSKILAALVGVSVISISVSVITLSIQSGRVLRRSITERNLQIARQLASEISRYVSDSVTELASFGQILGPLPYQPWIRNTVLANLSLEFKRYRWIGLLGPGGEVIADSGLDGSGSAAIDSETLAAILSGKSIASPAKMSEDDTPISVLSVPMRMGGTPGWLVAELNLRDIWGLVDEIEVGGQGVAYLVSEAGVLLAHPDKRMVLSPAAAKDIFRPPEDTGEMGIVREERGAVDRYITAYARVGGADLVAAVRQPISDAFLPASILLRQSLILVLIGLGLSTLLGVVFARLITAPLAQLLEGIRTIQTGTLDYTIHLRASDEIGRLAGSFNDMVGSLRQRTAQLERSELQHRLLTERVNDVIFSLDESGRFVFCSPRIEEISGHPPADLMGSPLVDLVPEADRDEVNAVIGALVHSQTRSSREMKIEIGGREGKRIILEVRLVADEEPTGKRQLYGVARDVSEREQLVEQLGHAQKMEAVGRLAGGIAHDFNNLLTAIIGYCDYSLGALEDPPSLRWSLEEIRKAGNRAAALTHQLLVFSRRQVLQPKIVDLNQLIANLEKLVKRLIGEDISLAAHLAPDLGAIHADPGQVEQVIMNLCINSRDAMPKGGSILLETANEQLDGTRHEGKATVAAGQYVRLRVSDTGSGMDEATKSHLFEPFFTTKEPGKGTGLGLSTVYGIVRQTGGYIWASSQQGKGATFDIYFPRVRREAQSPQASEGTGAVAGGRETILLVEDEGMIRELGRTLLTRQGYTVLEAEDAEKGEEIFKSKSDAIALIITDVVLPRMNGRTLVDRLREMKPGLPALFMSGYINDPMIHQRVTEEATDFFQKPFSPQALLGKVREMLDAHAQ